MYSLVAGDLSINFIIVQEKKNSWAGINGSFTRLFQHIKTQNANHVMVVPKTKYQTNPKTCRFTMAVMINANKTNLRLDRSISFRIVCHKWRELVIFDGAAVCKLTAVVNLTRKRMFTHKLSKYLVVLYVAGKTYRFPTKAHALHSGSILIQR